LLFSSFPHALDSPPLRTETGEQLIMNLSENVLKASTDSVSQEPLKAGQEQRRK